MKKLDLTLEELSRMVGNPVWIIIKNTKFCAEVASWWDVGYAIFYRFGIETPMYLLTKQYGSEWVARHL